MRLFAAVVPSPPAVEHLDEFLASRREAGPELRWTVPDQWHLTLAFMGSVANRHLDDLLDRLATAALRRSPFEVTLAGGGAFPDPARAKVLWTAAVGQPQAEQELDRLATGVRAAAVKAGADPDGGPFRGHVTLARMARPIEATRWLRVLDAYRGPAWTVDEITLLASHLGEGPRRRPRHEVVDTFIIGRREGQRSGP